MCERTGDRSDEVFAAMVDDAAGKPQANETDQPGDQCIRFFCREINYCP